MLHQASFPLKSAALLVLFFLITFSVHAQRQDGEFSFQSDPAKKYSLFVPEDYDDQIKYPLVLGLHPLNPSRWDAKSWCDTLTDFARANGIILVCPDGGTDGRIDDPIDTAFTSALLDSVRAWYSIDQERTYALGFSWGGKTTYTYAMTRPKEFYGFIPIGAAVSGVSEVASALAMAKGKPVYLLHGSNDAPSIRYTGIKAELEKQGAIVNALLMNGVGHTIDFPERNKRLRRAYEWIDSVNVNSVTGITAPQDFSVQVRKEGEIWHLTLANQISDSGQLELWQFNGQLLQRSKLALLKGKASWQLPTGLQPGTYALRIVAGGSAYSAKVIMD